MKEVLEEVCKVESNSNESSEGNVLHLPNLINGPNKLSSYWSDGSRKSAFQPYKQCVRTVLTNLQRGNTQAEPPIPQDKDVTFHTKAGQGEITVTDIKNEKNINVCDSKGLTALHWASAFGQTGSVELLISNGGEVDKLSPSGETPLLLASNGGHHHVVKILLNYGANVNHCDDLGNTALMYAANGNYPHTCNELLLKGADLTITNYSDSTAFDLAVKKKSTLAQAVIENHLLTFMSE